MTRSLARIPAPIVAVVTVAALSIVRGTVDDDELAALVAGIIAVVAAHGASEEAAAPTSAWMDRSHSMRGRPAGVLVRGDAAWRHSLR